MGPANSLLSLEGADPESIYLTRSLLAFFALILSGSSISSGHLQTVIS
jgi:hypothetical protein